MYVEIRPVLCDITALIQAKLSLACHKSAVQAEITFFRVVMFFNRFPVAPAATNHRNTFFLWVCALVFSILSLCTTDGKAFDRSDTLLHIVQQCLQKDKPGYCEQCLVPERHTVCTGKTSCRATTELWTENAEFVAIRDIKMCGCPADFVHGLVLPKQVVTGIEDDRRPDSIWQFAWDVAAQRLLAEEIALAVNSKSRRSQNQLHIHLVRLKPGIEPLLASSVVGNVQRLDGVWRWADQQAHRLHMSDYGLLVMRAPGGGYRVVMTAESPEYLFTQAVCTTQ
jgi:CDP-diacylglycerol pyrophosphatase